MITKADIDQSWMTPGTRIVAAALAEVGESVMKPTDTENSFATTPYLPLDVGYRASMLGRMGTGCQLWSPSKFLDRMRETNPRRALNPSAAELASMQQFYDLHARQ